MTTVKDSKHYYITFTIEQITWYCGGFIVGEFDAPTHINWGTKAPNCTKQQMLSKFDEDLRDMLLGETDGNGKSDGGSYYLQCTLVSKYSGIRGEQKQLPELQEHLLATGWKVVEVLINRNTGNEVTLYSKLIQGDDLDTIEHVYEDSDDEADF